MAIPLFMLFILSTYCLSAHQFHTPVYEACQAIAL